MHVRCMLMPAVDNLVTYHNAAWWDNRCLYATYVADNIRSTLQCSLKKKHLDFRVCFLCYFGNLSTKSRRPSSSIMFKRRQTFVRPNNSHLNNLDGKRALGGKYIGWAAPLMISKSKTNIVFYVQKQRNSVDLQCQSDITAHFSQFACQT